ncbi:MAG: hydantoinase/oxoprolinase family protein [Desulfovibrionaceae bacterium]|nr:hydantoinase/oxoprolinase family protein [Desulfovibrionaceae bacterium]
MLLGVDVGGTHTDAVVLRGDKIVASAKVDTDSQNLLRSITQVLETVLKEVPPQLISRLNLSTTLTTNALVEDKTEHVAIIVSAGPGMDPETFRVGNHYFPVGGAIDHRGMEVALINDSEIKSVVSHCKRAEVRTAAVIGKFSTRNPRHEEHIGHMLSPDMDYICMGHRLSGHLNFPRRVATAYYNAAVWRLFNNFADAVEKSVLSSCITAPINILKADGGTIPLKEARNLPVESILSGPAASVMGALALCRIEKDAVILDIGGTTTDISLFADGWPIIDENGTRFANHDTLVRAINGCSVGIGGDSAITLTNDDEKKVAVGPERFGPCMALGGSRPALMDAFNALDDAGLGDVEASRRGIAELAQAHAMRPQELALKAVAYAVEKVKTAVDELLAAVNSRPVYTIRELLGKRRINPQEVYIIGGPAEVFAPHLEKALGQKVILPPLFSVANAVGAALARNTAELELFADTQQGRLLIPNLGIERHAPKEYNLDNAKEDVTVAMQEHFNSLGLREDSPVDITEAYSFNMVGENGLAGRNIRVKCQVRPGLMGEIKI